MKFDFSAIQECKTLPFLRFGKRLPRELRPEFPDWTELQELFHKEIMGWLSRHQNMPIQLERFVRSPDKPESPLTLATTFFVCLEESRLTFDSEDHSEGVKNFQLRVARALKNGQLKTVINNGSDCVRPLDFVVWMAENEDILEEEVPPRAVQAEDPLEEARRQTAALKSFWVQTLMTYFYILKCDEVNLPPDVGSRTQLAEAHKEQREEPSYSDLGTTNESESAAAALPSETVSTATNKKPRRKPSAELSGLSKKKRDAIEADRQGASYKEVAKKHRVDVETVRSVFNSADKREAREEKAGKLKRRASPTLQRCKDLAEADRRSSNNKNSR